jgi:energy-coupling factor transporter transmembrane protein EcfT
MAELSVFAYHPARGGLNGFDSRFKLLALLLLTMAIAKGGPVGLLLTSALLMAGGFGCRVPLGTLMRQTRIFGGFLLLIWLVRAFGTTASESGSPLMTIGPLMVSAEGAAQGALVCWRLAAVLVASLLFIRTTRMAEMRAAAAWLLRPIPLIDGQQAATMLGLLVRFIPMILTQAQETRQALMARGMDRRRNPALRMRAMVLPLLRSIVIKADRISVAMEARGYSGVTTPYPFVSRPREWGLLGVAAVLAAVLILV